MVKIHIEIEGNNALEALADFRHLADALNPGHDADAPAPLTGAPSAAPDATGDKPGKSTRTRKGSKADKPAEAPAEPVGTPVGNTPAAAPESAPVPPAAPEVSTPTPAAPAPAPAAPAAPAPAPAAPAAPAPAPVVTLDNLAVAGSELIDKGRMADVMALLGKYGVQAITQLKDSEYPAFAADLRALGATI